MANMFNRTPRPGSASFQRGIHAFAPAFWRLVTAASAENAPGATPAPPETHAPAPQMPELTNEALQSLRDSTHGLAKDLQDIPSPPVPPYPPFTGAFRPPTNESLRGLRESLGASGGFLQDIPSPPERNLQIPPHVDLPPAVAKAVNEIWQLRSLMTRLEKEREKPERARDAAAFNDETRRIREKIKVQESILSDHIKALPGYRQI